MQWKYEKKKDIFKMNILRFATAGSVDDGKSTLIGRLLYDTNSLTIEQEEMIRTKTLEKGMEDLDLSVLTDGLLDERQQGITIDIAHIYFSTPKTKFIIADSPGHVEYTRNMVTGVSECRAVVVLVDARHGVIEQTYRHYFITSMLRIPNVIFCINKMDLEGYSEQRFNEISQDIENLTARFEDYGQQKQIIPVSALKGDNVVENSENLSWFKGESLLHSLENIKRKKADDEFRFYVQDVIRPRTEAFPDYRGFAGRISAGKISVGDEIMALPSRQTSKVKELNKATQTLEVASKGQSIAIQLEDEIDLSRGNVIVKKGEEPNITRSLNADICWMNAQALTPGKLYLIQTSSKVGKMKVENIHFKFDLQDPKNHIETNELAVNDIGNITLKLADDWFLDKFSESRHNGCFIVIDPNSNSTVGIGIVK